MEDKEQEIMELGHEPVPGYRPIFFVAITIGITYMAVILWNTL